MSWFTLCICSYRKFVMTTKVAETRGCQRCCVGRNPYNGYKYLCGILPTSIFLMQWYEPLNKFMLLKVCEFCIVSFCHIMSDMVGVACDDANNSSFSSMVIYRWHAHTCRVAFWSLLAVELLQGPHHQWHQLFVWSGTTLRRTSVQLRTRPMQLTVQDLWDNPAAGADFLKLDN